MEVIGSYGGRGQGSRLKGQGIMEVVTAMKSKGQISNQNSLIPTDLWCWLVDYGVHRREIDREMTRFLFDLYKHKSFEEQKLKNKKLKNKSSPNHKDIAFQTIASVSQFTVQKPQNRRQSQVPLKKEPGTLPTIYTNLSLRLPQRDLLTFIRITVQ